MEKEVIILVGSQGSGKTTEALSLFNKYSDIGVLRVSQDVMGRKGHYQAFTTALQENIPKIIVDRINHTIAQRKVYIDKAKANGYVTTIIDLTQSPKECFERIINRKNHPTIPNGDKELALKVLYQYYNSYQKPRWDEADNVNDLTTFNPNLLDLTETLKGIEYFITGDIHGCFDEFVDILIESKMTHIVSVGDIIDKGPKVREVYMFFRSNGNAYITMGNHENKMLRYLVGNKVNTTSLKETIKQTKDLDKVEFALFLMSMPKMIKIDNNYIFHAGINPNKHIENQTSETLLYARKFNPATGGFEDLPRSKYWHEYIDESNESKLFFGHHYHADINVAHNVYALDGHCVYGKELRAIKMPMLDPVIVKANKQYKNPEKSNSFIHPNIEPYEKLKLEGYLKRDEKDGLYLYKYTPKCVGEKNWNEFTRKARGIIFDKKTGELVARPFEKFFNLNEMPESSEGHLPREDYISYDKLDGSLGISYWNNGKFDIATQGSFTSEQAIEAVKIMKERGYYQKFMSNTYPWSRKLTFLFEIVYPENKVVCDYLGARDVFLIGAIDRETGKDYDIYGEELSNLVSYLGVPRSIRYPGSKLEELIQARKPISKDKEGWVIKYKSGLRVKLKGEEYLKIHRMIDKVNPIHFWENMEKGYISKDFLDKIPEEFRTESIQIINNLHKNYDKVKTYMLSEIDSMLRNIGLGNIKDKGYRKKVGLYLKKNNPTYGSAFFPYLLRKEDIVEAYIMKTIRPKGLGKRSKYEDF